MRRVVLLVGDYRYSSANLWRLVFCEPAGFQLSPVRTALLVLAGKPPLFASLLETAGVRVDQRPRAISHAIDRTGAPLPPWPCSPWPTGCERGVHPVAENKIRERFHRVWTLVAEAILRRAHATVYDNSDIKDSRNVAQMAEGLIVGSPDWPDWTTAAVDGRWPKP